MKVCIAAALALAVASPGAAAASGVTTLLPQLTKLRDHCAQIAKKAADKHALDQYQVGLDLQLAQTQAQMDARVYGVGHGSRETRDFYLSRLQSATDQSTRTDNKIAAEYAKSGDDVAACVKSAESDGRFAYTSFKSEKGNKPSAKIDAESLMTAWLANLEEISLTSPDGSDGTSAQWKTAKARAEVDSM